MLSVFQCIADDFNGSESLKLSACAVFFGGDFYKSTFELKAQRNPVCSGMRVVVIVCPGMAW